MGDKYKILGQSVSKDQFSGGPKTIYTVPAGKSAAISSITITFVGNFQAPAYDLYVVKGGNNIYLTSNQVFTPADFAGTDGVIEIKGGIVLSAGDSIAHYRATDFFVVNVYGVEQEVATGISYKVLGYESSKSYATGWGSATYTVPSGKQAVITSISSAWSSYNNTYDLAVVPAGETLGDKHFIRKNYLVGVSSKIDVTNDNITLAAGDKVYVRQAIADTLLSFGLFGVEIDVV